jgi:hypothetical protein
VASYGLDCSFPAAVCLCVFYRWAAVRLAVVLRLRGQNRAAVQRRNYAVTGVSEIGTTNREANWT